MMTDGKSAHLDASNPSSEEWIDEGSVTIWQFRYGPDITYRGDGGKLIAWAGEDYGWQNVIKSNRGLIQLGSGTSPDYPRVETNTLSKRDTFALWSEGLSPDSVMVRELLP